jgi:hypothetical protein
MTNLISGAIVAYWRLMPVLLVCALWVFFAGTKKIRKLGRRRIAREVLLLCSVFGFLFALTCFGCYGLVDPQNHLARPGAVPVTPAELTRFALLGYVSLLAATAAAGALEWELRRG